MAELKVSRRYAKSLLGLAQESNLTEKIFSDMLLVESVFADNREMSRIMRSPIIQNFKKESILKGIFSGKVDKMTLNFILMMISKGRVGLIEDIAREYIELHKQMNGVRTAYVTTAVKLDESIRQSVLEIVRRKGGEKVELVEKVDPEILGGLILRMGDKQFDASVSRKLNDISRRLHSNSFNRN